MGDVGERPGMDQYWGLLAALHQRRVNRLFHHHCHGPGDLQIVGGDRLPLGRIGEDHLTDTRPHIGQAFGEGQNSHQLRGGADVKAVVARHPVVTATHADLDAA